MPALISPHNYYFSFFLSFLFFWSKKTCRFLFDNYLSETLLLCLCLLFYLINNLISWVLEGIFNLILGLCIRVLIIAVVFKQFLCAFVHEILTPLS